MKQRKREAKEVEVHRHKIKTGRGIQTFGHPHPVEALHTNNKTQAHHNFTVEHDRGQKESKAAA